MTWLAADALAPGSPWAPLAVALPLAGALASVAFARWTSAVAWLTITVVLTVALLIAGQVWQHGVIVVPIGGWAAPLGIALRVDGLSAALVLATAIVTSAVALFALASFGGAGGGETRFGFAFWPLLLAMWAGLNAVFLGNDLFNLYVAMELLTLTAVALVALEGTAETLAAGLRYLLFALFGSLAYLLGVALLYGVHGTLDITRLAAATGPGMATWVAGSLMTVGLLAKTALFPLHVWLPPAHAGAPAPASAMLSGLVTKASFYLVARLWFDAMPTVATEALVQLLGALGAAAILVGSILALLQERLKLIIAYSTVAQIGYLFLIFPLAGGSTEVQPWTAGAWSGGIFHALSHAAAKAALFLAAGIIIQAAGHDLLDELSGIARAIPMTVFAMGLAALSLMGLPPSGGFIAKYLLLTAALASGQWWWAAVMIAGGLLAAAYLFRPLSRALAERHASLSPVPRHQQVVSLALAICSVLLGIFSFGPYRLLQIGRTLAAAEGLP